MKLIEKAESGKRSDQREKMSEKAKREHID